MMPLPVIYGGSVSAEDIHSRPARFVEDSSQSAVSGNAHAPSIRIGSADKSHFRDDHAGRGGLDPGRDCPVARSHIKARSGGPAGLDIGSEDVVVDTVERQCPSHFARRPNSADNTARVAVACRIDGKTAAQFIK